MKKYNIIRGICAGICHSLFLFLAIFLNMVFGDSVTVIILVIFTGVFNGLIMTFCLNPKKENFILRYLISIPVSLVCTLVIVFTGISAYVYSLIMPRSPDYHMSGGEAFTGFIMIVYYLTAALISLIVFTYLFKEIKSNK